MSDTYKDGLKSLLHHEFEERLQLLRRADAINHNLEEENLVGEPKLGSLSTFQQLKVSLAGAILSKA